MSVKVSIIVPTYNNEHDIEAALRYLLNQDYNNFEIIVIDDCSTDNTYELAKSVLKNEHKAKIYKNTNNIGGWNNYYEGIKKSSGDYVVWACADDIWESNFVSSQIGALMKSGNNVACFFGNKSVSSDQELISEETYHENMGTFFRGPIISAISILVKPGAFFNHRPTLGCVVHGIIKKDVLMMVIESFKNIGPIMNERMVIAQLALIGDFAIVHEVVFTKRVYSGSYIDRGKGHDPSIKSNYTNFYLFKASYMILLSILSSKAVPLLYKIQAPVIVASYLSINLTNILYINVVSILNYILPRKLYCKLKNYKSVIVKSSIKK